MAQADYANHVLVVGAGPAGCSCALWLAKNHISCTLIEREAQAFSLLRQLRLQQSWVLGFHETSTEDIARQYTRHLEQTDGIGLLVNQTGLQMEQIGRHDKRLRLADGSVLQGAALVVATGLRARRAPAYAGANPGAAQPMDAIALTQRRASIHQQRVLLLGGGDNAVENALYLDGLGNRVTLWARGALRAKPFLVQELKSRAGIEVRMQDPMPTAMNAASGPAWQVSSRQFGAETFDQVAVLFGFEPESSFWDAMVSSPAWAQQGLPQWDVHRAQAAAQHGIFLAGDISGRHHPCIQTALADGVAASFQAMQWINTQRDR
jgi:thioredoxin reductase